MVGFFLKKRFEPLWGGLRSAPPKPHQPWGALSEQTELLLGRGALRPLLSPSLPGTAASGAIAWVDIASGFADIELTVQSASGGLYPFLRSTAALSRSRRAETPETILHAAAIRAPALVATLIQGQCALYHSSQLASIGSEARVAPGLLGHQVLARRVPRAATWRASSRRRAGQPLLVVARVCTPAHYDSMHNSLVQLEGRKRVWLWSPAEAAALFTWFPASYRFGISMPLFGPKRRHDPNSGLETPWSPGLLVSCNASSVQPGSFLEGMPDHPGQYPPSGFAALDCRLSM